MKKMLTNARNLRALLFAGCLIGASACKKTDLIVLPEPNVVNPITDFEITRDPNDIFKYTFKNKSEKFKKLEWRFGDDTLKTDSNPTHRYFTTGKYLMNLTTISATGHRSKKQIDINIHPDSVMRITTQKLPGNQIRYGLVAKAPIGSVTWTFNEVSPAVTTTEANPVRTYEPGTFNTFTVKVTTVAGSTVSITSNNATAEGVLQDITQLREGYTISAENTYGANENSTKLLDGSVETKLTMGGRDGRWFTYPLQVSLNYTVAQTVKMYCIGNANDLPNRDVKSWSVQGSNDGITWEILDQRVMAKTFFAQMTDKGATTDAQRYKKLFFYAIADPKPFFKYRLSIESNWGEAAVHISEFRIYR
ncbi:PKD domain-containing protein [Mucilaginibacter myungsuensis]|uniref:PKD domain-containing protein n=1 Tax=Mucilaginibacter myungsuensis TaxID=649104 RepID=A0A929KYD9_9SPHI|nr:PKD domain-containing protein [Mucilaginibacter myungsuensis]MBE9663954.1 hypothetical protein [Mucilaginibacter myungsuensis]MDN3598330.1 PKD domain-containing protein [Mucilaginibacter myungsuensis]